MDRRTYLRTVAGGLAAGTVGTAGCSALDGSSSANTTLSRPELDAEPSAYPYPEWSQPIPEVTLPAALSDRQVTTTDVDTPLALTFIYTTCMTACPVLTLALTKAQERAIEGGWAEDVTFAEITFDPDRDTPAAFRQYAEDRNIELDTGTWHFLRPESTTRARTVVDEEFGVPFQRTTPEDMDQYMFTHSTLILLVNADGYVERAYRDGQRAGRQLPDHLERIATA
ncbi:SCO family protein [Halorientalis litorea]|jgi:protein SCO1/2|uniref:SCO family protein n=1 Tax=Halorientalis litorea TaxID=2931977 RepID=UPI001FF2AC98|nr:SCO family protein [Halorientalis litorea]